MKGRVEYEKDEVYDRQEIERKENRKKREKKWMSEEIEDDRTKNKK